MKWRSVSGAQLSLSMLRLSTFRKDSCCSTTQPSNIALTAREVSSRGLTAGTSFAWVRPSTRNVCNVYNMCDMCNVCNVCYAPE